MNTYRFYWDIEAKTKAEAKRSFRASVNHVINEDGNEPDDTFDIMLMPKPPKEKYETSS